MTEGEAAWWNEHLLPGEKALIRAIMENNPKTFDDYVKDPAAAAVVALSPTEIWGIRGLHRGGFHGYRETSPSLAHQRTFSGRMDELTKEAAAGASAKMARSLRRAVFPHRRRWAAKGEYFISSRRQGTWNSTTVTTEVFADAGKTKRVGG